MIRVATLDHHPAVRAGIEATLDRSPDLISVGSAADEQELWPLLQRTRPDVVLVDQPSLTSRIKQWLPSPKVVLYVEEERRPVGRPRADGVVGKTADLRVLLDAVRGVVHAGRMPAVA